MIELFVGLLLGGAMLFAIVWIVIGAVFLLHQLID